MNRVFKNLNIFLAQKIYFFLRKNSKNCSYLTRIYAFLSEKLFEIFKFYETYKSREIFGEFPYLVEKFTVAAKGIFSGGTLGPLKYNQAPTAGGPGGEGPPDGSEVSFFKTIQSI